MKYVIKGEIDLKIGGSIPLLPCACELHIGGGLADDTTPLLCSRCETPRCLETANHPLQKLPEILRSNWLDTL